MLPFPPSHVIFQQVYEFFRPIVAALIVWQITKRWEAASSRNSLPTARSLKKIILFQFS